MDLGYLNTLEDIANAASTDVFYADLNTSHTKVHIFPTNNIFVGNDHSLFYNTFTPQVVVSLISELKKHMEE